MATGFASRLAVVVGTAPLRGIYLELWLAGAIVGCVFAAITYAVHWMRRRRDSIAGRGQRRGTDTDKHDPMS